MHRLHEIEYAIELYSSDPYVFRAADLYKIDGPLRRHLERYNVYLVTTRPRYSIEEGSLSVEDEGSVVAGVIQAHAGEARHPIPIRVRLPAEYRVGRLEPLAYPCDRLRFWTPSGLPLEIHPYELLRAAAVEQSHLTDFHVEYIGQAFGDEGSRDALDRLIGSTGKAGHGSFQRVLAEIGSTRPDREVYVLLYSFEFYKKVAIAGGLAHQPSPQIDVDKVPDRLEHFMQSSVSRETRIDLVEASLIRHFAPRYNDRYKTTFPAITHTILRRLHELDVTGLSFSLSTLEHNARVGSERAKPSDAHWQSFPIRTDEDRLTFFDLAMPAADGS